MEEIVTRWECGDLSTDAALTALATALRSLRVEAQPLRDTLEGVERLEQRHKALATRIVETIGRSQHCATPDGPVTFRLVEAKISHEYRVAAIDALLETLYSQRKAGAVAVPLNDLIDAIHAARRETTRTGYVQVRWE
jgi:uncharacterized protein (UPF0335 family)